MKPSILCLGIISGVLIATAGLTGCTSSEPLQRPSGMASSTSLSQDPQRPGAWVYRLPDAQLQGYNRFIIEPAQIYNGPEASFDGLDSSQLNQLAQQLTSESRTALTSGGYALASQPGPNTARIVLKLVSVEQTVPGAATASRLLPIGAVANAVQGASGGSGSFTGGITLAAEAYDTQTNRLLAAAVRSYHPAVFDMKATLSTMDTAQAAVSEAAQDLRAALDRVHGRTSR